MGVVFGQYEKLYSTSYPPLLKVWEGYFKELLNWGGSNGELELSRYVEGKVELVEITEKEVWIVLKRMKGRASGIDVVHTEMIVAA